MGGCSDHRLTCPDQALTLVDLPSSRSDAHAHARRWLLVDSPAAGVSSPQVLQRREYHQWAQKR